MVSPSSGSMTARRRSRTSSAWASTGCAGVVGSEAMASYSTCVASRLALLAPWCVSGNGAGNMVTAAGAWCTGGVGARACGASRRIS